MTTQTDLQTVPVHVVNTHEFRRQAPPEKSRDIQVITQTYVLKTGIRPNDLTGSLVARILDRDLERTQAIILVSANTYLCHSSVQAEAAVNDSSNTVQVPQDGFIATSVAPFVLKTTDPLWAVVSSDKASTGVMVSVIIERRRA